MHNHPAPTQQYGESSGQTLNVPIGELNKAIREAYNAGATAGPMPDLFREPKTMQPMGQPGHPTACVPMRQTAIGILRQAQARWRQKADQVELLIRSMPQELPPEADAILWQLFCDSNVNRF